MGRVDAADGSDRREFLQRVVDSCAAKVVALDETGTVLHVSRAWRLFAAQNGFPAAEGYFGLDALQSCNETVPRNHGKNGFVHDAQKIIQGLQVEIEKEYILKSANSAKWFLVRAAKLDMPGIHGFRILVTLEDITRRKLNSTTR